MNAQADNAILEGLLSAMRAEHEGFHFYSMAARNTDDEKGREVFNQLADDEREHLTFLKNQYLSLRENGAPNTSISLSEKWEARGPSPIFSDDLKRRVKDAHFEMTALSIGIQMELSAVKHYKNLADAAEDDFVKQFFLQLSEWESGHYQALLKQQESFQEDYWAQNGFSPL
jgi:rubrerythrin